MAYRILLLLVGLLFAVPAAAQYCGSSSPIAFNFRVIPGCQDDITGIVDPGQGTEIWPPCTTPGSCDISTETISYGPPLVDPASSTGPAVVTDDTAILRVGLSSLPTYEHSYPVYMRMCGDLNAVVEADDWQPDVCGPWIEQYDASGAVVNQYATISGLIPASTYCFRVQRKDSAGNESGYSTQGACDDGVDTVSHLATTEAVDPVSGQEYACWLLGDPCLCSEQFDFNAVIPIEQTGYNPPDSTAKECTGTYGQFQTGKTPEMVLDTDTDAAIDLAGVTRVYQMTLNGGINNWLGPNNFDFTNCSLAIRWYKQFSTNWPDDFNDSGFGTNDVKANRFTGQQNLQAGHGARSGSQKDGYCYSGDDFPHGGGCGPFFTQSVYTGTGADWDGGKGTWQRFETVIDHNAEGDNGGQRRLRYRVIQVGDVGGGKLGEIGRMEYAPATNGNTSLSGYATANTGTTKLVSFTTNAGEWAYPYPSGSKQWFSHMMFAKVCEADEGTGIVPADRRDWWIGPACEIEDGAPECP